MRLRLWRSAEAFKMFQMSIGHVFILDIINVLITCLMMFDISLFRSGQYCLFVPTFLDCESH